MRITSGKARGISLDSPKGDSTRPATDAARLAIFSSIGESVLDAEVLDIFAGTGSYGLEALSRGAKSATFIESDRHALICLRKNAQSIKNALGNDTEINIIPCDCLKTKIEKTFDIIFADPPYDMLRKVDSAQKILCKIAEFLKDDGFAILEAPAEFELNFETISSEYTFEEIKRLGKKSKGKPSQIIFKCKQTQKDS